MNQVAAYGLSGLMGGALYGAIGGAVVDSSPDSAHPVAKAALITGIVGGTLATIYSALRIGHIAEQQQLSPGTAYSSSMPLQGVQGVYFP